VALEAQILQTPCLDAKKKRERGKKKREKGGREGKERGDKTLTFT